MVIVDANVILRYLLGDNPKFEAQACKIIDNSIILLLDEVLAEVVYVFEKVYKIKRNEISHALKTLIQKKQIFCRNTIILENALQYYTEYNIDFIDCLLLSCSRNSNYEIQTFDNKLNKLLLKK